MLIAVFLAGDGVYSGVVFTVRACNRQDGCELTDLAKSKTVPPFSNSRGRRVNRMTLSPSTNTHSHDFMTPDSSFLNSLRMTAPQGNSWNRSLDQTETD